MSDEDRLCARMHDWADRVPDLADLDDVAVRLGRRRPVRERRLLALVAVALVAGVAIGVVIGHRGDDGGPAVAVAGDGSPDTTIASTTLPTNVITQPFVYCDGADLEGGAIQCHPPNTGPTQTLPAPGQEQPTNSNAARARVAAAYVAAMDGDTSDVDRSAAIEGGASLVSVFQELHNGPYGAQVRSAHTVIDGVVFVSATKAAVKYHAVLGDGSISGPYLGDAVLHDGEWQVSRESYCQVASLAGVHCPA